MFGLLWKCDQPNHVLKSYQQLNQIQSRRQRGWFLLWWKEASSVKTFCYCFDWHSGNCLITPWLHLWCHYLCSLVPVLNMLALYLLNNLHTHQQPAHVPIHLWCFTSFYVSECFFPIFCGRNIAATIIFLHPLYNRCRANIWNLLCTDCFCSSFDQMAHRQHNILYHLTGKEQQLLHSRWGKVHTGTFLSNRSVQLIKNTHILSPHLFHRFLSVSFYKS